MICPAWEKAADDPGPFSLDRLAQAVASVVDAVGRSTVLVGHSMGGQIAELVAPMRPRQIAGLALLSPVPHGGMALPEASATALRSLGGKPKGQRELRIQSSSHLTAADLDGILWSAGHWPNLEQPAATAAALDDFLSEIGWSQI